MSLTQIAVLITGVWLIVFSQEPTSEVFTLICGIAVAGLVLAEAILRR